MPSAAERDLPFAAPQPLIDESATQTGVLPRVTSEPLSSDARMSGITPVEGGGWDLGVAEVEGVAEAAQPPAALQRPPIVVPQVLLAPSGH